MTTTPNVATALRRQSVRPTIAQRLGRSLVRRTVEGTRLGRLTLIDGNETVSGGDPATGPSVTVRVRDPRFYSAIAFEGGVGASESFIDGEWTCDDLPALFELLIMNRQARNGLEGPMKLLASALGRAQYALRSNTKRGSRRNIVAHYDLGDEFFSLFLDPTMTYSCGIFENGATTLEESQIEKIDRACRKLDLKPSDHLLEIGTGWGALAVHAARAYGCRVTTTTISDRQHDAAAARIREAGLDDRITLLKQDYRDLEGAYDKVVSIEMIEAVGKRFLTRYVERLDELLEPDGMALIQAIVVRDQEFEAAARQQDFLKKYIFPGSCLPSVDAISERVRSATDMRVFHLEDIGPHYATTLRMWRDAFMDRLDDVRGQGFDDRFIRMWEYYLAYCEGSFTARHVGDVQMLLTKPLCRRDPVGTS